MLRARAGGWETAPTEQVSSLHPRLQMPTHLLQASLTPRHQSFSFQTQTLLSRLLQTTLLCWSFDQELEGPGHHLGSVQLRLVILPPLPLPKPQLYQMITATLLVNGTMNIRLASRLSTYNDNSREWRGIYLAAAAHFICVPVRYENSTDTKGVVVKCTCRTEQCVLCDYINAWHTLSIAEVPIPLTTNSLEQWRFALTKKYCIYDYLFYSIILL